MTVNLTLHTKLELAISCDGYTDVATPLLLLATVKIGCCGVALNRNDVAGETQWSR